MCNRPDDTIQTNNTNSSPDEGARGVIKFEKGLLFSFKFEKTLKFDGKCFPNPFLKYSTVG